MALARRDDQVIDAIGRGLAGAQVYICTQPAATTVPYGPLATVYTDGTAQTALANPLTADGYGRTAAYVQPGTYTVIHTHPLLGVIVLADQGVGVGGSGSGSATLTHESPVVTMTGGITTLTFGNAPQIVYRNSLFMRPGIDYTPAGGSVLTLTVAAVSGDYFDGLF